MATHRTFHLDAHLTPEHLDVMVNTHPKLEIMAGALERQHGMSRDHAKTFLRRMMRAVLEDFGETYTGEMSVRLERIGHLRDRIAGVYESVLAGKGLPEGMTPTSVAGLFAHLEGEIGGLKSPTVFAKEDRLIRDDLASESLASLTRDLPGRRREPQVTGRLSFDDAIAGQTRAFSDLAGDERHSVARAAEIAPDIVRRMVDAENEQGLATSIDQLRDEMSRRGVDAGVIDAAAKGIKELNSAQREQKRRFRTKPKGPYDPSTPEGRRYLGAIGRFYDNLDDPEFIKTLPVALRDIVTDPVQSRVFHDPDLRKALEANVGLARIAHESPTMLMEMWLGYSKAKKGKFGNYVLDKRTRSHMVGLAGEFHAAFQLGDSHVLLKGPDYDVTIPGTDLVAVAHKDGTVWLIDNKALRDEAVGRVNALVDNILPSMERDVRDFGASGVSRQPAVDPQVRGAVSGQTIKSAVDRVSKATKAVRDYLTKVRKSQVGSESVQKRITAILEQHGVKRVVTNAGGKVTGLSDALTKIGIEIEDLNK